MQELLISIQFKPLDKDLVIKAAKETGKIVTVEEHSVIGGLGSAVADVVSEENLAPVHKNWCSGCIR